MLLLLLSCRLDAQYSVSANDEGSIRWRQIETERFRLVYPDFYEANAQRLARVLDTVSVRVGTSLGTSSPRIPVLIHTNSSKSNGLLVWAPKRMEFWTTPPPTHYAYPWSWQLSIHEYRHACQMQALNQGISKTLNTIFGEHILGAISGLLVPYWFMEGDAVVAETAMSPTGRGQTPDFKMRFKAQLLDKGAYKFDKAKLGSLKDYVPDRYVLGYYMSAFSRAKYGSDVFAQVLSSTSRSWWKGSWFNRTADASYRDYKVYEQLVDTLSSVWQKEREEWRKESGHSELQELGAKKKYYTSLQNPIRIGEDSILALQSDAFSLQSLVLITDGKVKKLRSLPYLKHSYFDYHDGKILYSQDAINTRWMQQNNTDIIEYDIHTHRYRVVSSDAIFFNPVYNPKDETLIAAILTDKEDNQSLVVLSPNSKFFYTKNILDRNKGLYVASLSSDSRAAFSFPCWSEDAEAIYVIETTTKGKSIAAYNVRTGQRRQLTEPSFDDISRLSARGGRLYFLKDLKGKYELVSLDLESGSARQESDTEYGIGSFFVVETPEAETPFSESPSQGENSEKGNPDLLLSAYSSDGYRVVSSRGIGKGVNLNEQNPPQLFVQMLREQENFMLDGSFAPANDAVYESKPYSKLTHLINFHSWAPIFLNVTKQDIGVGVSAFSQNLLSTSVLQFGYKYNTNDIKHELYLDYTYSGLYPIIDFESSYKMRSLLLSTDTTDIYTQWSEFMNEIDITVPYYWNTQRTVNSIKGHFNYSFRYLVSRNIGTPLNELEILELFSTMGAGVTLSMVSASAANDIVPQYGLIVKLNYKSTLTSSPARFGSLNATTYIPMFLRNQALQCSFKYQRNSPDRYYFPNEVSFTRGVYNEYPASYYGLFFGLHTPLGYPDLRLGPVIYCKRISAAPFYEIGAFDGEIRSCFGSDVNFKVHLLRIETPVDLGFRLGWLTEDKKFFFNFLFSIDV